MGAAMVFRTPVWSGIAALAVALASAGAAASSQPWQGGIEGARLAGVLKLEGPLFHVQGLELDRRHIWVTSVDNQLKRAYIHQFDRASGRLLRRADLTDGVRFHPGGISLSGSSIWVPVAEYRPDSTTVLLELDAATLAVRRRIAIADHLGCVAVRGRTLVAGNWDSRLLYVIDSQGEAPVRAVPNPSPTGYQDMKFAGDTLVASGTRSWLDGTVDWIDPRTMTVSRTLRAGATASARMVGPLSAYTREGMAIEGHDLYLVPEDGESRLFRFRLDADRGV